MSKNLNYKILSLGTGQSNFLSTLYADLKAIMPNLEIDIDGYFDISKEVTVQNDKTFTNYKNFNQFEDLKLKSLVISFITIWFYSFFWKVFIHEIFTKKKIIHKFKIVIKQVYYLATVKNKILPLKHDLYHFQFCKSYNLRFIHYLPLNKKSICSFWGSDLYRMNHKDDIFYVKEALKKTDIITIQTPEMGYDLLKKYGNQFKDKITYAQFSLDRNIFEYIDSNSNNEIKQNELKTKLGINNKNTVITIAYNAFEANNHLKIIEQLSLLPKEIKSNLSIILPLAYGKSNTYLKKIDNCISQNKDLHIIKYEKFLNQNEISILRLITDIQIQMPVSDALSSSVTEVMYAGNIVLAASWLPYDIFERLGIYFRRIKSFEDIVPEIKTILSQIGEKKNYKKNKKIILENFFSDVTIKPWVKIYKSLLSQ